jgi:hypothetical protein
VDPVADVCREFDVGGETCRDLRLLVGLTIKGMPVVEESNA